MPELFRAVIDDLGESPQEEAFAYNIDVLAPQNFNEAMFSGFQEAITVLDHPQSKPQRCKRPGQRRKGQGTYRRRSRPSISTNR